MTYQPTDIEIQGLIKSLRLLWNRYMQDKIERDEMIEKLERILYMSGVVQE